VQTAIQTRIKKDKGSSSYENKSHSFAYSYPVVGSLIIKYSTTKTIGKTRARVVTIILAFIFFFSKFSSYSNAWA
jgi:hypothetical protein